MSDRQSYPLPAVRASSDFPASRRGEYLLPRNRRRFFASILVPVLLVVSCATFKSNPPNKQALQILDVTRASVAAAVTVFNGLIAEGKVSEPARLKAIQLRQQYLAADKVAVDGLAVSTVTDATVYAAPVKQLADDLVAFIATLKGAP
jgi:hypothetical protein